MLHIKKIEDGIELYKALGSDLRIQIIRLLLENTEMNLNEIAAALDVTNGALTSHIRRLEQCGLISILSESAGHGNQKICRINTDRILIDVKPQGIQEKKNMYSVDIPVGQYTDYSVFPTCGISTPAHLIGEVDDPRYFAHPDRTKAGILWFGKGYVEYLIPNLLPAGAEMTQITLSAELSSEAPGPATPVWTKSARSAKMPTKTMTPPQTLRACTGKPLRRKSSTAKARSSSGSTKAPRPNPAW